MRMIFVNLPVKNLVKSKEFFSALGFSYNPDFTTDDGACMIVEENIYVMLLSEPHFRQFIVGEISDTAKGKEVLTCLSAGSRAEVDDYLAKALAAGGKPWKPILEMGLMYGCSFQDLDGHVWEIMYMDMGAAAA
ncbi:VOC family protein [Rhizobium binxianense]